MKPREKRNRKPNLYFSEGPSTRKGYKKEADDKAININAIKRHVQETIVKEETRRNKGALKGAAQATAKLDMAAIKAAIQEKIKRQQLSPVAKIQTEGRVATGIPGLDEVMENGFRAQTVNLIGGGAGSGKSIFSMQFLVNGIDKYGENGVYISFEQTPEEIFEDMKRFGWELEKKVKEKKLVILHYTPEQVEKVLEAGGGTVRDTIESINARRLVIDSVTAFTLLHESPLAQRRASLTLFENIKRWGCTALVVSEQEPDPERHYSDVMEFEVDGVILLYNIRKGDIRERSLEIYKMRGVHHAAKIFPMKISEKSKGIEVFPEETVF